MAFTVFATAPATVPCSLLMEETLCASRKNSRKKKKCHVCDRLLLLEDHYLQFFGVFQNDQPEDEVNINNEDADSNDDILNLPLAPAKKHMLRGFKVLEISREFDRAADKIINSMEQYHAYLERLLAEFTLSGTEKLLRTGFVMPPEQLKPFIEIECGFTFSVVAEACLEWEIPLHQMIAALMCIHLSLTSEQMVPLFHCLIGKAVDARTVDNWIASALHKTPQERYYKPEKRFEIRDIRDSRQRTCLPTLTRILERDGGGTTPTARRRSTNRQTATGVH